MKRKLESIKLSLNFRDGLQANYEEIKTIKEETEQLIHTYFKTKWSYEPEVSMVTVEKNISEILYEDVKFRVVRTRACHAIVQHKKEHKDEKKDGYTWIDKAFYGANNPDECLRKAMKEIHRLSTKRKYKSVRSTKKREYIENIPNKDKEMLRALLG